MQTDPFKTRPAVLAKLPRIARLFICHGLIGFVISAIFTALVVYLNIANIGHLVMAVDGGWLAAAIFFVLNGSVFSGVQTAIFVMSLGDDEDDDQGGGTRLPAQLDVQLRPVPSSLGNGRS